MKKLSLVFFLLLSMLAKAQSAYEVRARYFAEDYYKGLHRIAEMASYKELAYSDQARKLELQLLKLIGEDLNGHYLARVMRIPNDIDQIFGSKVENRDISISTYLGHFTNYAEQNSFSFTYEIISCEELSVPSLKGDENTSKFVEVVVKKTIRRNRKTIKVKETMVVGFHDGEAFLSRITNSYGDKKQLN